MPARLVEYDVSIRNAEDTADEVVLSSVRGAENPDLASVPTADGEEFDPTTGKSRAGSFTLRAVDRLVAGTTRVLTSRLEDAGRRQQLLGRRAVLRRRFDGGLWTVLAYGYLKRLELVSGVVFEVEVSDGAQRKSQPLAFAPGATETDAAYLARFPIRGCLFGGPLTADWLGIQTLAGWEAVVEAAPGGGRQLRLVAGYLSPKFGERITDAKRLAEAINPALAPLYEFVEDTRIWVGGDAIGSIHGRWPSVLVLVDGVPYARATTGTVSTDTFWVNGGKGAWVLPLAGAGSLTVGARVRVRAITRTPSELSPLYLTAHPADLWGSLYDGAGIPRASVAAARAAVGADARLSIRITELPPLHDWVDANVLGMPGLAMRTNGSGQRELFAAGVMTQAAPLTTITALDVAQKGIRPFVIDDADRVGRVVLEHKLFRFLVNEGLQADAPLDGIVVQPEELTWNLEGAPASAREVRYTIAGAIHTESMYLGAASALVRARGVSLFGRYGRGGIGAELPLLATGAGANARLGDEVVVALPQLPNRNKRLGDDATIPGRVMQIVRLTPVEFGAVAKVIDSGPAAQFTGTMATLALASSATSPRTVAEVTVTNAAALNAESTGVRIQTAVTTGGAPASSDFTDFLAFEPGTIPTTAIALPPSVAGRAVFARIRSERASERPSGWSAPVSLSLSAIAAPTGLVVTPSATDGSRAVATWTIPATSADCRVEVLLRRAAEPAAAAALVATMLVGSTRAELEQLTPGVAWIVGVRLRDPARGDLSSATEVPFTSGGTAITLDAPTDATGWACAQGGDGVPVADETYGIAVGAVVFPGEVEVREAVETAVGSNVFPAPASVAFTPGVQGAWTIAVLRAPNDGRMRRLSARSVVRDGAGAVVQSSTWTAPVDILPWTPAALPAFASTTGSAGIVSVKVVEDTPTTRTYLITGGARVKELWCYYQRVQAPLAADPFAAFANTVPNTIPPGEGRIIRGTSGTLTITKPARGFYGLLALQSRLADLSVGGEQVKEVVQPLSSAMVFRAKAAVTGDQATLEIGLAASPADYPVLLEVRADDPDGPVLASWTLTADGTRTAADIAALGNIPLPVNEQRLFHLRATNVAGEAIADVLPVDRDPLARVTVTVTHFRDTPSITCAFDDDTDAVRVTVPGGRTKTWTALVGSGTRTYTVGDPLDDLTTEAPFAVDQQRTGYRVEGQGGGTWTEFLAPTTLRGRPSNPPTARARFVLSANRDAADVYIEPASPVGELLRVHLRDAEGGAAPVHSAVEGAADTDPLWVTPGTELGPASYFYDGVGEPTPKLGGIPLGYEQLKRLYYQIEGKESGLRTDWLTLPLSAQERPFIESISVTWDEASGTLRVRVKGGAHCASVFVEVSSASNFATPLTASSALVAGQDVVLTFALTGSQRGRTWHARATPFNAAALGGLEGVAVVDEVAVGALFTWEPPILDEPSGKGRARITVADPGSVIDPAVRLRAFVTRLGVRAQLPGSVPGAVVTPPAGGATSGLYTFEFDLDEKHPIALAVEAKLRDGSFVAILEAPFDADKTANVVNATAAENASGTATVTVLVDSDAATGTGAGEYQLGDLSGGGPTGAWYYFDIDAYRTGRFNVPQSTTARRQILVRARNTSYEFGPAVLVEAPVRDTNGTVAVQVVRTAQTATTETYQVTATDPRGIGIPAINVTATNTTVTDLGGGGYEITRPAWTPTQTAGSVTFFGVLAGRATGSKTVTIESQTSKSSAKVLRVSAVGAQEQFVNTLAAGDVVIAPYGIAMNAPKSANWIMDLAVPKGVTITAFRYAGLRGTLSDGSTAELHRVVDGGSTIVASVGLGANGSAVSTGVDSGSLLPESTAGSRAYAVRFILNNAGPFGTGHASAFWIEIDYTAPSLDVTL